ncbi:AIPR family protein [Cyanobacterium stanieri LEGE 03274]|uniref:AIPR family protein n=1 Tax=Cyanobacterium stanieri LEGE 03274 TaxID=1828756 RepID=A0ABR9V5C7_9CHRO|nr:AIPR family protein [Cyanobacterium stanieri]MBE9223092.1 AIPR family protein [Cyanobacterium stanieri LEGE 03274]
MADIDPVINTFIQEYLQDYELEPEKDYTDFEKFACYCVFSSFNRTGEEFDVSKVHTGKPRDTGLDGVGILIDNILVNSEEEADNVIGTTRRTFNLKFVFVQAKLESSFNFSVVEKTVNSVKDFFADYKGIEPLYSRSQELQEKALLANYILNKYHENRLSTEEKPECNVYYTTISYKTVDSTVTRKQSILTENLEQELNFLKRINFCFWGAENLEKLYKQTKRRVETIIQLKECVDLEVNGIEQAYMTVMSFSEFKKIILHQDHNKGIIDFIFYDNVRGFLGQDNPINEEIKKTLESNDKRHLFPILNNGVTLITEKLMPQKNKVYKLINYQIVNGCQTSHVLGLCKDIPDIENTTIPVKIIETDDENIRNAIIRATNSQTQVGKEFIAALSEFNPKLEEFYQTQTTRSDKPLYYERRPGQFFSQENVVQARIITIRSQIKAFMAMFLDEPHSVNYFDKSLIERIGKDIYVPSHYPIAYYASSWAFYQLNYFVKKSKITIDWEKKDIYTKAKYYILMIFKYLAIDNNKFCPSCGNRKEIDKYCQELISIVNNLEKSENIFKKSCELLIQNIFNYRENNKNIEFNKIFKQANFTDFILTQMNIENKNLSKDRQKDIANQQGVIPFY